MRSGMGVVRVDSWGMSSSSSSSVASKVDLSNQTSVVVARKALDQEKEQGAQVNAMIKAAADTQKAANAAARRGGVDVQA